MAFGPTGSRDSLTRDVAPSKRSLDSLPIAAGLRGRPNGTYPPRQLDSSRAVTASVHREPMVCGPRRSQRDRCDVASSGRRTRHLGHAQLHGFGDVASREPVALAVLSFDDRGLGRASSSVDGELKWRLRRTSPFDRIQAVLDCICHHRRSRNRGSNGGRRTGPNQSEVQRQPAHCPGLRATRPTWSPKRLRTEACSRGTLRGGQRSLPATGPASVRRRIAKGLLEFDPTSSQTGEDSRGSRHHGRERPRRGNRCGCPFRSH